MRLRAHLLVYLLYLVVVLVITFPLITTIGTRLLGHPFGDAYEYVHHIWWIKTALQSGQNPFFMPNLLYPDGLSAALLWSLPLQSFPAWLFAFVMSLPAAFNLAALLTLALNGWAMFWLARYLVADLTPRPPLHCVEREGNYIPQGAALAAGLAFLLYPAFQGQLGAAHTGLLTLWPAPIYLYCLLRLRDTRRIRETTAAGALFFAVSLWGSALLLIYLIAPITALYGLMLLRARAWLALRRTLVTVMLGAVLALPLLVPLAVETLRAPPEAGSVRYSAALLGVAAPSFYHPLFNGWDYSHRVLGVDPFEQASYIGVIAAGLATVGFWKVREARWWLLLALSAWVFSLGPLLKVDGEPLAVRAAGYATHIPLPWALFQNLPLLSMARTPARFNFAVGFAVAVLIGYGVRASVLSDRDLPDWRLKRPKLAVRWAIVAGLMALLAFEYQFWWPLPTSNGVVPAPIAALATRSDLRAVLDIPWYHPLVNKDGMFLQTGHHLPMIIGQISRRSPINPAKVNLLQETLDPALLDAAGVDVVILHKEYDGVESAVGALTRSRLGQPFYEDAQSAVFLVPPYSGDPPGRTTYGTGASLYFYAPQPGPARLVGQVEADGRGAEAALDGVTLVQWTARERQALRVPVEFTAGYHTITVALDPACPAADDAALRCPLLTVTGLGLEEVVGDQ